MKSSPDKECRPRRRGRSRTVRERHPLSVEAENASSSSTSSNQNDGNDCNSTTYSNTKTNTTTHEHTKSNPTYSSTFVILFLCIILSMVVTLIILHQVGYEEEVRYLIQEIQMEMKHNFGVLFQLSSLFRFVNDGNGANGANDVKQQQNEPKRNDKYNNQTYQIYDLNQIEKSNDGYYLPSQCKEKDALLEVLPNNSNNDHVTNNKKRQQQQLCRNIITKEMKMSFDQDGVIAIRGLLSSDLFHGLNQSSHLLVRDQIRKVGRLRPSTGKQFFINKMGVAFINDDNYLLDRDTLPSVSSGFQDVALSSLIPQVVAELLNMEYDNTASVRASDTHMNTHERNNDGNVSSDDETLENMDGANLRMIRDVLLVKDTEQYVCGWHVDDLGFWPTTATSPGINAWIAIDDMSITTGGNFAISVGTHKVSWRHEVYELTGATTTHPEEGYKNVEDMFQNRKGAGTCNIKNVNRKLHDKLEERMRVYDLKAGDVLFLDRWLFHRTIAFDRDLVKEKKRQGELNHLLSRRYSIRYTPGIAQLPKGWGTEHSILWNEKNEGRTLDAVERSDGPWYPQCWPHSFNKQQELQNLIQTKLPITEARRKERINEMKPFLQQMGKQQSDQLKLNARNAMRNKPDPNVNPNRRTPVRDKHKEL